MNEALLAERIAREIHTGEKKRILVRNVVHPEELNTRISGHLDSYHVLTFNGSNTEPVRESLLAYFTGDGIPDADSSFEAGWRSHLTEIALVSSEGMECAAGLNAVKEPLKNYLLHGISADNEFLAEVFTSFGRKLPVLLSFINCINDEELVPFSEPAPPVVVIVSGEESISHSDLVLDSDSIGLEGIQQILEEHHCSDSPGEVLRITDGVAGIVRLYAGIREVYGIAGRSTLEMLREVFNHHPEMKEFACAAALLPSVFLPAEVAEVSGTEGFPAFQQGKKINLWRGHLLGSYLSEIVRKFVSDLMSASERNRLLVKSSEAVISFRGISPVSLKVSGQLLASAGRTEEASERFVAAGEIEDDQLLKACLFQTASALNPTLSGKCLFLAALSLFRIDHREEALRILQSAVLANHSDSSLLRKFCSEESVQCLSSDTHPIWPEISPVLLKSRFLHGSGAYTEAERLLTEVAATDDNASLTALVELGDQLFRRGLFEQSLCVMRAALNKMNECSPSWIETKIRYVLARVFNRTGRFREFHVNMERLMELALVSSDRRRLVSLYNLQASSMLLGMDLKRALNLYRAALKAAGTVEGIQVKSILNNLSIAQRKLHLMNEALSTLMRLVRVCVASGDLARASIAYGNMARLFIDLSRFGSAADCLETMIEFSALSGNHSSESICYISAQIAFCENRVDDAVLLMDKAVSLSRSSGSRRKLSLNLVKKGSMLLRAGLCQDAAVTLREAVEISSLSNSPLNHAVASMKLSAAECFLEMQHPHELLSPVFSGGLEDTHRGEGFYWHWRLTGSRQSMTAAAQLLSTSLLEGLHHHSYLYMLQEIAADMSSTLAAALPLVHNYPSCNSMKGD